MDEYVRVIMAQQFEAVISRGYSPEVTFDAFSYQGAEVTFSRLNWDSTLRAFRETRKEGKSFPLRTPAFNVSERGIELLSKPSPEQYAQLHKEYSLDDLFRLLDELGADLWAVTPQSTGDALCPQCKTPFERTSPSQIYCGDRCRKRAKSRRWRERDPERARLCQARYWKRYSELD